MNESALQRLLRRDAVLVSAALVGITALAWIYVIRLAADMHMSGMDMTGMRMISTGFRMVMASAQRPWTSEDALLMFVMWAVMMIGMMTPSVAPVVLLYARVQRHALSEGDPFAATGWFAGGYLLAWTLFSALATAVQWGLERAALLTPMMTTASRSLGAILLIGAGVYNGRRSKRSAWRIASRRSPSSSVMGDFGETQSTRSRSECVMARIVSVAVGP